jgi:hypothetical protein
MSDPSMRSFPGANVILVIVFLGVAGLGIWMAMAQLRLSDNLAAMIKTQSDLVKSQRETSTRIEQQTDMLHRALGNVLPVKMPPDWESRLTDIEAQIADTNRWPKDAADAQRFLDQTSSLINDLPVRAEADYLPRLNSVRWAAMAFVSLHPSKDFTPPNEQVADQLNTLASTKPEGGSSELEQSLKKDAERRSAEAESKKLAEAIKQAQHYLDAKATAAPASPEANPNMLSVFEFLGLHEKDDKHGAEVQALRKKLHEGMVTRQAEQQADALQTRWNVVQKLKNSQPAVYETSANMLLGEVMTARVALAIEGVRQPAFDMLENDLRRAVSEIASQGAKREEQRQALAIREYQHWALQQIKTFEEAWGKILESVAKRKEIDWKTVVDQSWWGKPYSPDVWVWSAAKEAVQKKILTGWEDQDYKRVRDAMVNHLLAINLSMLEMPVQERYQQAFQLGWKQLDGRDGQTYVAEQTAVTVKKSLRDFLENQP